MLKNNFVFLLTVIVAVLSISCKSRSNSTNTDNEDLSYEYPFSVIGDTLFANINEECTLYPLRDEVLESFMEKAGEFEGRKWTAGVQLPDKWGVKCVERLNEGKELWLLSSESRDICYLAITSGYGTQRIIDVLPIAMSITNQRGDELETETWRTLRLPDGQFQTVKEYEWIRSMANATKQAFLSNPENYHRKTKYTEQFFINDDGRFEKTENLDTLPDYKAVVFYFNSNEKPLLWDENIPQLQAFCEENGILYEEVSQNFNRVTIRDYELTFAMEKDITPYIGDVLCGMVMMSKENEPKVVHFGSFEYMQMEIRRYFKLRSDLDS